MDTTLKFSPILDKLFETGKADSISGVQLAATGLASRNTILTLRNLCMHLKAKRTLEVGLAYGSSCLMFAQSHVDLSAPPTGQHVAMDPFQQDMGDAGLVQMEAANLTGYLTFYRDYSFNVLPRLLAAGDRFDLCFIDGSHLFEDAFLDAFYCGKLLNDGGVMVLDDASDPHVSKVCRYIETNMAASLKPFDLTPFRSEVSIKYKVAKALGKTQIKAFQRTSDTTRPWNSPIGRF